MRLVTRLRLRLRSIFGRRRLEIELDEELRYHIDRQIELNLAAGMSAEEARFAALREFGGFAQRREECRDARGLRVLDDLQQDVAYGIRMLVRYPAFTFVAVLSLALGIGANTVVFGVMNGLLLRPLPIPSPEQLHFVDHRGEPQQSFPNYRDIRDRNAVFLSLFMYRIAPMSLGTARSAQRVWGYLVTGNYFDALGIQPAAGRFFGPDEDLHPGASPYAVLSYESWHRRFQGNPAIVGRTIRINMHSYTVLGVAPEGFQGTETFYWPEVWLPMTMQPQIEGRSWLDNRQDFNGWVAGRLRPGVTVQQADANLAAVAEALAREHTINEGMQLTVSAPGLAGSALRRPVGAFVGGVMLLAALVLLSACANIASLLSARLADRRRELSLRLALGAGRGRVVRQLLTESVVLSCAGGLAAVPMAAGLLGLLSRWQAPLDFPIRLDVSADPRVFAFAFAIALLCGALFGAAPALRACRQDPNQGLKGDTASPAPRRWATRDLLLIAQVAVCGLLVTATLVALRGLTRSLDTPLGFEPAGAAVVAYDLGFAGYDEKTGRAFHQRALEATSRIPGVTAASLASSVPLSIDQSSTAVFPERVTDFRPQSSIRATYYRVSPGFFQAMGTRLIAGRDFTDRDGPELPPVAVVNETFARRVLGAPDCVGCRFRFGANDPPVEVIGVVEDGKYETLTEASTPVLFQPMRRHYSASAVLIARSSRPEGEVAAEMRRMLAGLDPELPVYGIGTLIQMLGLVYLPVRAAAIALSAFGALAVMLALTGISGLAAYTVSRRRREIGIRMAIGARAADVLRLVLTRTAVLVAIGSAAGLILGALGSRVLESVVIGASARDPLVMGGAAMAMIVIGTAAVWGPVRRALQVDPVQALRQE